MENNKIRILSVSQRTCIRTLKQLSVLSHKHDVHVISKRLPEGFNVKTSTYYDGTEGALRDALKLYKEVDVIYLATEPAWTVFTVRSVLPHIPLVIDVHDAQIWRSLKVEHRSAEERQAFRWADGVVVPSGSCKRILEKFHKPECPVIALPPYVPESFYQSRSWGRKGGIVYQGRVDLPTQKSFMDYCKYEKLAKVLKDEGIPFHLYMPGKKSDMGPWKEIYQPLVVWHNGLPYEKMLSAMGFHDWGLAGNIDRHRDWDVAMPNKLFDYLAGGIPVIALNAKETGKFVEKHGVGISVHSVEEIKERWDEREACQRNVFLKRHQFTMENHIHKLEELFERVCKLRSK